MESSTKPFVSVLIPLFEDERILKCLTALTDQTYGADSYEIIVVDNGSSSDILTRIKNLFPNVHALTENTPGSYAARNAGIEHAKGSVYAFTDADCIPFPEWIEEGVWSLFSTDNVGLVGGALEFFSEKNPDGNLSVIEKYDMRSNLKQQEFVESHHFAATANAFYKKEVLDIVGPFNQHLKSGGDADLGRRLHDAGFKLVFSPLAKVSHPARNTLESILTRTRRIAGGNYQRYYSKLTFLGFMRKFFRKFFNVQKRNVESVYRNDYSTLDKVGIFSIIIFLKIVTAYETVRLKLGGDPERK